MEQALKKNPGKSAGGPDEITKEKITKEQKLTDLLNQSRSSRVPKEIKKFKMHLIEKVANSGHERPLNVGNMFRRILTCVRRTTDVLDPRMGQRRFERGMEGERERAERAA